MIYCFGDSWGYGIELKENEKPFVYWLAKDLEEEFKNFSVSGNSYPVIVTQIFDNIRDSNENFSVSEVIKLKSGSFIYKNDIVLIVIPPDIRWMDQEGKHFISWWVDLDEERYMSWLGCKFIYLFYSVSVR